jgi:hypothetical protein
MPQAQPGRRRSRGHRVPTGRAGQVLGTTSVSPARTAARAWSRPGALPVGAGQPVVEIDAFFRDAELAQPVALRGEILPKSPRTAMRYVKPGDAAVAEVTSLLGPPRRSH